MTGFIPVNKPLLNGNEQRYLLECIETGWISSEGPFVGRFEDEFAARMGKAHGISVSNGSVAIDVAVAALGLKPDDEVILPTFTIISCIAPLIRAGVKPVLVDADSATWTMNPDQVRAKVGERTKAIMVVHTYGLPVDMDPILDIAREHDLAIIEDAAEAHGSLYRGRPCGSFGTISTFSFYANKHVTTGEGGMVLTDDAALAERAKSLRNLCFKPEKRFVHDELGSNFRFTNIQAAIGLAQLERLDETLIRKRALGARYRCALAGLNGLQLPADDVGYAQNDYWVFGVVLDDDIAMDAVEVAKALAAKGIGTRPFFWCMHEQPIFEKSGLFAAETYPVAERLARRGLYLPSGIGTTDDEIDASAAALVEVLR